MDALNLKIVLILTIGFGLASLLGYLTQRAKLSPILGYLIAGYLIGPYSPGYTADLTLAEELAEIGVILMMFGVGLHFKWQDLLHTSHIAIPGAICQTLMSTIAGAVFIYYMGWSLEAGIVLGLAIGVASTVVLVRLLSDNHILNTPEGHIAVGWLIVEDLITVVALLLIQPLAGRHEGADFSVLQISLAFGLMVLKFIIVCLVMFTVGRRIVAYFLSKIMKTESHELFTLSVLAITFIIATGSTLLLGTSIALGAFIAGIVMGQTNMRQKIYLNSMPLKDAFSVIFFLSIGMLFNPYAIVENYVLFIGILVIILMLKPLVAFLITIAFKYPLKTAFTIAIALAQIGEFSFILSEEALKYKIIPDDGYDILVACALVSIAINPLFYKFLKTEKVPA